MLLFKASGATFRRVVAKQLHAFRDLPRDFAPGEFVLLSKNREDCRDLERQVQFVGKLKEFRAPMQGELEREFPGVAAEARWAHVAELYWVRKLVTQFNLFEIPGFNYKHYQTVQDFAKLTESDTLALLDHLVETNPELILDFMNNAMPPPD